MESGSIKLLAISSGGGHWVQLLRLSPAFAGCNVVYVTVERSYAADVKGQRFYSVPDATRWTRFRLFRCALRIISIICKERPRAIISTGAAPGYVALRIGAMLGIKTIWLDSIANAEELSMSGRLAGRCADLWLTQWPHLAGENGPYFRGAVL